jgi:hypothetical protein
LAVARTFDPGTPAGAGFGNSAVGVVVRQFLATCVRRAVEDPKPVVALLQPQVLSSVRGIGRDMIPCFARPAPTSCATACRPRIGSSAAAKRCARSFSKRCRSTNSTARTGACGSRFGTTPKTTRTCGAKKSVVIGNGRDDDRELPLATDVLLEVQGLIAFIDGLGVQHLMSSRGMSAKLLTTLLDRYLDRLYVSKR